MGAGAMTTPWTVTAAADRITLDADGGGEVTFTATNSGVVQDRVMFEAVPDKGADRSWFAVGEPERVLAPSASVPYLVKISVPAGTKPGSYSIQGRAYSASADQPPEENSAISGRVTFEVPPATASSPPKRWWLIVAAALLVVVLGVVGLLVFGQGGEEPPTPPPVAEVVMPDLVGMSIEQARAAVEAAGLTVGNVTGRVESTGRFGEVVDQSVQRGVKVPPGTTVDLVVRSAPEVTDPVPTVQPPTFQPPTFPPPPPPPPRPGFPPRQEP